MDIESLTTDTFQLRRVDFVPAQRQDTAPVPKGVNIIVLNGTLPDSDATAAAAAPSTSKMPGKELFREQDVTLRWKTVQRTGAGLQNLGNTCFMNSVLQCLTHTPPLAEAMLAGKQLGSSRNSDPLRLTQQQVINALQNKHKHSVAPTAHAKSLRQISKSFRLGRQEDAHEYLVALLDAMHESYLNMCRPKPSPELSQTSMIYRIFAGKIRSQVKCTECGHESNTYDTFLDLSLEINRASDLTRALQRFTGSEYLDGANKYICPKQKRKVRAAKCMTVEQAPAVLVIQLKRFEFSMFGHKINKKVDFETELDLRPYMSNRRKSAEPYSLYGVLVHSGHSVHSGHYFAFVKGPNGLWHQLDDNHVSQVSERVVLAQKAYILFYIKTPTNGHSHSTDGTKQFAEAPTNGTASDRQAHSASTPAAQTASQQVVQPKQQKLHVKAGKSALKTDTPVVHGPHQLPTATSPKELAQHTLDPSSKVAATALGKVALENGIPHDHDKAAAKPLSKAHTQQAAATVNAMLTGPQSGEAAHTQAAAATGPAQSKQQPPQSRLEPAVASSQQHPHGLSQTAPLHHQEPATAACAHQTGVAQPLLKQLVQLPKQQSADGAPQASEMVDAKLQKQQSPNGLVSQQAAQMLDAKQGRKRKPLAQAEVQGLQQTVTDEGWKPEQTNQKAKRRKQDRHLAEAGGAAGPRSTAAGSVSEEQDGNAEPADQTRDAMDSTTDEPSFSFWLEDSPAHDTLKRSGGTVIYHSPHKKWHGRSWNRLNLHHRIHQSRQLVMADLVTASRPQQRASAPSPGRALPSSSSHDAERPLPHASHSSLPSAQPTDTWPYSLEGGSHPSTHAQGDVRTASLSLAPQAQAQASCPAAAMNGHAEPVSAAPIRGHPQAGAAINANADRVATAHRNGTVNGIANGQHQAVSPVKPGTQAVEASKLSNGVGHATRQALQHNLQLPNGNSADLPRHEQQAPEHKQQALGHDQKHRSPVQPASAKDMQNGLQQPLAPWDDVDPDLVKQARSLNRESGHKKRHKVDDWDSEYDMGKVKKVKSKRGGPDAWQAGVNVFMKASQRGGRKDFGGKRKQQRQPK